MKKPLSLISILTALLISTGCSQQKTDRATQMKMQQTDPVEVPLKDGKARAYFASGCFWCVEAVYESVKGVEESISGYAGGHTENPTYEAPVTPGKPATPKPSKIIYDPEVVSFATLVDVYFGSQNVTQANGQGQTTARNIAPSFSTKTRSRKRLSTIRLLH